MRVANIARPATAGPTGTPPHQLPPESRKVAGGSVRARGSVRVLLGLLWLAALAACAPSASDNNKADDGSGLTLGVAITLPASPPTIEAGAALDFAATASGGSAPYTFAWNFDADVFGGGPAPSAVQNPSGVVFAAAGTYRVEVVVTDADAGQASASLTVTVTPAGQVTLVLQPSRDNTLYGEGGVSNGAGEQLFAGRTSGGAIRRALLAFDLGQIPSGATIVSATLTLTLNRTGAAATDPYTLHRLGENWGEGGSNAAVQEGGGAPAAVGDATWSHAFHNTVPWSTAGGAYASTPSADWSISRPPGQVSISSSGMAADVATWLADSGMNFGWLLRHANDDGSAGAPTNRTARRFASRENTIASARPRLTIVYISP